MKNICIPYDEIEKYAHKMKEENYRLVQISATRISDKLVLDYSFGREYEFVNIKTEIESDTEIESISHLFYPAFLYENEMHDLYGIKIKYISVDYEGTLYRTAVKKPFNPLGKEEE